MLPYMAYMDPMGLMIVISQFCRMVTMIFPEMVYRCI